MAHGRRACHGVGVVKPRLQAVVGEVQLSTVKSIGIYTDRPSCCAPDLSFPLVSSMLSLATAFDLVSCRIVRKLLPLETIVFGNENGPSMEADAPAPYCSCQLRSCEPMSNSPSPPNHCVSGTNTALPQQQHHDQKPSHSSLELHATSTHTHKRLRATCDQVKASRRP